MKENNHNGVVSFAELMALIEKSAKSDKIPYEEYKIIGDTTEIDRIICTNGFINTNVDDVKSTLSKETTNYVSIGSTNDDYIMNALNSALAKLPIDTDRISKLLIMIWLPKGENSSLKEISSMLKFINKLPKDIEVIWGSDFDESMKGQLAKVSLIAASK